MVLYNIKSGCVINNYQQFTISYEVRSKSSNFWLLVFVFKKGATTLLHSILLSL